MFFRTKTTRSGKALQLVESYRNREGKPRQRIVVSLGDMQVPDEHRRELARLVEDALYGAQQQKIYEMLGVGHRNLPETKTSVPMKNSSIL